MPQAWVGKRVLVTGGTRGVGRATVLAFAREGADVVTCHRAPGEAADSLTAELEAIGGKHEVVTADVTTGDGAARLAETCRGVLGGLDVVVNNVGIDGSAPLARLAEDDWRRLFDHNVTSAYLVTRAVLDLVAEHGSIVNIGSAAALRGRPDSAHYSASKAALTGFTRGLCKELGPRRIRVNLVAPGFVDDGSDVPPPLRARLLAMTPLGRLARPEDIAGAVLFLAGDQAAFVSGTTLTVDGGM